MTGDEVDGPSEVQRDLPSEDPPAFVDYLLNLELTDRALAATILDLARRGHITVRHVPTGHGGPGDQRAVTLFERGAPPDRGWERHVLRLLFDSAGRGRHSVDANELRAWVAAHPEQARAWWDAWKEQVPWDMARLRWVRDRGLSPETVRSMSGMSPWALGLVAALLAIFAIANDVNPIVVAALGITGYAVYRHRDKLVHVGPWAAVPRPVE
jgi:hypothetical protein